LSPGSLGEEVLKLKNGSEILGKKNAGKVVDCRVRPVTAEGTFIATTERCPDVLSAVMALPRTASNWVLLLGSGALLVASGSMLLRYSRRKLETK
jgi:LPXTG-motif cell wall-anchored protein